MFHPYSRRWTVERHGQSSRIRSCSGSDSQRPLWQSPDEQNPKWVVQLLSVVDNSAFLPSGLTVPSSLLLIRKLSLPPIFNSEDRDVRSCVRIPARGLPALLSGEARVSGWVPFSAFLLTRWGQAQHIPPSPQASHPG